MAPASKSELDKFLRRREEEKRGEEGRLLEKREVTLTALVDSLVLYDSLMEGDFISTPQMKKLESCVVRYLSPEPYCQLMAE